MNSSQSEKPGRELRLGTVWPWAAIVIFLLPMSLSMGNVGISANYTFLALLLATPVVFVNWPRLVKVTIVYSVVCYVTLALLVSDVSTNFYLRQFISFSLFLGALLIAVVRMPFDIQVLARVTVWVSVGYTIVVILALLASGTPITNAGMVKAGLATWVPDWPQRYIIVVMLGFFLAVYLGGQVKVWLLAAGLCGFCIAVSYGRAASLAMFVAITTLSAIYLLRRDWASLKRLIYVLILSLMLVLAFAGKGISDLVISENKRIDDLVTLVGDISVASHHDQLMDLDAGVTSQDTLARIEHHYAVGGEASGAVRLEIWSTLVHRMIRDRMWLGSGFAGPWLFEDAIGSAHSQYVDILFRTGPVGLALYLCLWGMLIWRCFRHSPELGSGMLAWFIYGFFHETTKYSYGAFLFFALLSLAWFGWERASTCDREAVRV